MTVKRAQQVRSIYSPGLGPSPEHIWRKQKRRTHSKTSKRSEARRRARTEKKLKIWKAKRELEEKMGKNIGDRSELYNRDLSEMESEASDAAAAGMHSRSKGRLNNSKKSRTRRRIRSMFRKRRKNTLKSSASKRRHRSKASGTANTDVELSEGESAWSVSVDDSDVHLIYSDTESLLQRNASSSKRVAAASSSSSLRVKLGEINSRNGPSSYIVSKENLDDIILKTAEKVEKETKTLLKAKKRKTKKKYGKSKSMTILPSDAGKAMKEMKSFLEKTQEAKATAKQFRQQQQQQKQKQVKKSSSGKVGGGDKIDAKSIFGSSINSLRNESERLHAELRKLRAQRDTYEEKYYRLLSEHKEFLRLQYRSGSRPIGSTTTTESTSSPMHTANKRSQPTTTSPSKEMMESFNTEKLALRREVLKLKEAKRQAESKADVLKQKVSSMSKKKKQLEKDLNEQQVKSTSLEKKFAVTQKQLLASTQSDGERLSSMKKDLDEALKSIAEKEKNCAKVMLELKNSEESRNRVTERLTTAESQLSALQNDLKLSRSKEEKSEQKTIETEAKLAKLKALMETRRKESAKTNSEVTKLRIQVKKLKDEMKDQVAVPVKPVTSKKVLKEREYTPKQLANFTSEEKAAVGMILRKYQTVAACWRAMDKDKNGRISWKEFNNGLMSTLGGKVSTNELARSLWGHIDIDGSGDISYLEWKMLFHAWTRDFETLNLEKRRRKLAQEEEEAKAAKEETATIRKDKEDLVKLSEMLKSKLEFEEGARHRFEKEANILKKAKVALEKKLKILEKDLQMYEDARKTSDEEGALKAELHRLQTANIDYEKQNKTLLTRSQTLSDGFEKTSDELEKLQKTNIDLEESKNQLEVQVSDMEAKIATLEKEKRRLASDQHSLENLRKVLEKRISVMETELAKTSTNLDSKSSERELEIIEKIKEERKQDAENFQKEKEKREKEFKEIEEKLREEIDELKKKLEEMEKQKGTTNTQPEQKDANTKPEKKDENTKPEKKDEVKEKKGTKEKRMNEFMKRWFLMSQQSQEGEAFTLAKKRLKAAQWGRKSSELG